MFRLFVNSSTGVDIEPEYNFKDSGERIESRHRTRDGSEYAYRWGSFRAFKMDVTYVDSAFKSFVNSWWDSGTDLLFMETGTTDVYSVHIVNKNRPVDRLIKPYTDLFRGTIELETY